MGATTLNPSCFTSDGTYIYTHALVTTTDMGANTNVLAKSNASPASIADVTWTLVSAVALGDHYLLTGLPMQGTFDCTVDSTGVFTVMDSTSRYGVADETPVMARGLQYTPGAGGAAGTWTNIDVSAGYKWSLLLHSVLFPLGGTLMQIYRTSIVLNTLTVSIFDKTNNTFVEQSSPYTLDTSDFDNPMDFAFNSANNNLYSLWTGSGTSDYLVTTPVSATGAALTNTTNQRVTANLSPCDLNAGTLKSGIFKNQYYLWCQDDTGQLNYITSSDGTGNFTTPIKANTSVTQPNTFIPMGPAGGAATWAFVTTSTPILTNLYGMSLAGANIGAWQTAPNSVVVNGLQTSPGATSGPGVGSGGTGGGGSNSGSGGSGGVSPAIIGAVAGVIVVTVLGGAFFFWRRSQIRKKNVQIVEVYQPPVMAHTTYIGGQEGAGGPPPPIPGRPLMQSQVTTVGYAPQPHLQQPALQPQEVPVIYNPDNYYPPPPPIQSKVQDPYANTQTPPMHAQNPQEEPSAVHVPGHNPQETPAETPRSPEDAQDYQQQQSQYQQYAQQFGAGVHELAIPGNPHSDMDSSQQHHSSGSPYLSDSTTVVAPSPFMYNGVLYVPQDPQLYPSSPLATNSTTMSGGTPNMGYSAAAMTATDPRHPQLYVPGRAPQGVGSVQYQGPSGGPVDAIPAGYVRAPFDETGGKAQ